jgi:hypothetical protein
MDAVVPGRVVVNLKGRKPQLIRQDEVYIGRGCYMGGWKLPCSVWYNPFPVRKYGRSEALRRYEAYIRANPELLSMLEGLRGRNLACWCHPEPCHGEVLLKLLGERLG